MVDSNQALLLRKTGHDVGYWVERGRADGLKNDAGLRDRMRDEHSVSGYADDPFDRRVRLTSAEQVNGELLDILARALDQNS